MISIDDQTYQAIATQLRDELTGKEFFNGQLEYDTEEFYSTLTCTLILRNDPDTGRLASATPVWWEYHLHQRDAARQCRAARPHSRKQPEHKQRTFRKHLQ